MTSDERAAISAAPGGGALRDTDIGASAAGVIRGVKERLRTVTELAAAEIKLAALSGVSMLLLAIVTGAALVIAWLLLVGLAIFAATLVGIDWPLAALILALLHVGVAYWSWRATVRLSRNLTLPQLRGAVGVRAGGPIGAPDVRVEGATGARRG